MDARTFITSLYASTGGAPSFFELLAQEKLLAGLHPAVRFVVNVLADRYPEWSPRLSKWEWYFWVLLGCTELHFLHNNQGSFSEYFYEVRREVLPRQVLLHTAKQGGGGGGGVESVKRALTGGVRHLFALFTLTGGKTKQPKGGLSKLQADREDGPDEDEARKMEQLRALAMRVGRPLSLPRLLLSVFFVVGLPLLKARLHEWHQAAVAETSLRGGDEEEPDGEERGWREKTWRAWRLFLVKGFPWVHAGHQGVCAAYQLLFLLDPIRFPHWSPHLHCLSLVLRRAPPSSSESPEMIAASAAAAASLPFWERVLGATARGVGTSLKWAALGGIYGLRLLEWYYQAEAQLQPQKRMEPPPPPKRPRPQITDSHRRSQDPSGALTESDPSRAEAGAEGEDEDVPPAPDVYPPADPRLCPLCHRPRANPAACVSSGFVFCYSCIVPFVREHERCPVTGVPSSEIHVRRIFEQPAA
uniref:Peroxin-12 n=2 Tax=Chromera velia TaxID=505693 RepID=A0A2K8DNW5_9ALVE|nr:Peroxisome biogenesis protein 12 [Chromera velia]|mmetsp:Transcript_25151/g.49163  ORF Transcript_25151/g.49163 Transcript_25151/m.49163 type:complete len:472 (+) Transcript_25151:376-1791(+)|eukprot:Cvel_14004.t1-p1 / transcript=Cvel_14004.t1 / gene=Cvel_14004 / organism=Chromera_velia_CCMP2878 / gene_product=Putative peroxisome assembly protein 12, putative / transcript_product=Putative peroxisome assembly protein 12, putative / location=Cvel_scaffold980:6639-11819(+) / protein_length=471 / sequence_SO=supercontig / SO=protein_coding / is_pseudo=false